MEKNTLIIIVLIIIILLITGGFSYYSWNSFIENKQLNDKVTVLKIKYKSSQKEYSQALTKYNVNVFVEPKIVMMGNDIMESIYITNNFTEEKEFKIEIEPNSNLNSNIPYKDIKFKIPNNINLKIKKNQSISIPFVIQVNYENYNSNDKVNLPNYNVIVSTIEGEIYSIKTFEIFAMPNPSN